MYVSCAIAVLAAVEESSVTAYAQQDNWPDTKVSESTVSENDFVTTWQTTTANETITIPVNIQANRYTINWGDGSVSANVTGDQTHTYADAGIYTVRISGSFTSIYLDDAADARKLISIDQWGNMKWKTMLAAFEGASNMQYNATDAPDLSEVTVMDNMFNGASSFDGDLSNWDVSNVQAMYGTFRGAHSFNGNIANWNVSSVDTMYGTFRDAHKFNQDLSNWDVSNVNLMYHMFHNAHKFNQDLSNWDVSNVIGTGSMFQNAHSFNGNISNWDVSNVKHMSWMFDGASSFDGNISNWDVSSIVSMVGMFDGASSFSQNLGNWYIVLDDVTVDHTDPGLVVGNIAPQNAFLGGQMPKLTYTMGSGGDSASFTVNSDVLRLANADLAAGTYDVVIKSTGPFGTSNSRNYTITVTGDNSVPPPTITLTGSNPLILENVAAYTEPGATCVDSDGTDLSSSIVINSTAVDIDTPGSYIVTYTCTDASYNESVESRTVTVLDMDIVLFPVTYLAQNITLQGAGSGDFVTTWRTTTTNESIIIPVKGATGTYTIDWGDGTTSSDVSGDQTHTYDSPGEYAVRISGDFTRIYLGGNAANAQKMISIDQWGDMQWTSMESAFRGASNVQYSATDAPDLTGVTDMRRMFTKATLFNGNLSSWDVSGVTLMTRMFGDATSFNGDISGWDVSGVSDMRRMFNDATSFHGDVSEWDVSNVDTMRRMFNGATSFNGNLSSWDVSGVDDMRRMFNGATSFHGDISGWNVSGVSDMKQMFRAATSFNGDLALWDVSGVTDMDRIFDRATAFDQNMGKWYIILNNTSVDGGSVSGVVGSISAQNSYLDKPSLVYGIGDGNTDFVVEGGLLKTSGTLAAGTYAVNITATGGYGSNNHRLYDITVT